MADKTTLRDELRRARLGLDRDAIVSASRMIAERLKAVQDWSAVKSIHCFRPIRKLNEPNVSGFLEFLQTEHPEIKLFTSEKIGHDWQVVTFGGRHLAAPATFDVIIVPMLGFDGRLHRIGYGGGYYDKFLAAQPQARKIGVCYEQGKIARVLDESHDISLDMIITEEKIYI